MTLTAGTITRLQVAREVSPYGYFLTDGEQDVILHYSELTGSVKPGDEVDVFLFYDTEDRLASTMKRPYLTLDQIAPLQVADVHPRYGCFLEMGIGRQLLLPKGELPDYEPLHPQVGDTVYVKMIHDRVGRLVARAALEQDLVPLAFHAPDAWRNTWHEAVVYRALKMGTFLVLDGGPIGFGAIGFLHESLRPRPLRLGEKVRVRVTHIREDGRVNVTMAERKEIGMDMDADRLFSFLRDRPNGAMPYSDETPADIVKQRFGMSKSAFKRAVGRLMRAGLVKQQGSWTELSEKGATIGADELQQILQTEKPAPPRPKKR
ncbi:S1-like domain-containing RNA-binding protein [Paenibacillus thiaminolyticus]|uniref:RNA-binding protein n=1 Tax=Paenibacillus thiaminolyticus TaxID=49283 RepID=A0AAP9DYA5_PANTH|nr:S1-like domain-containing RNA-binding protein [Paenibacillus thiaminolyticus]MCY9537684.1 S1-like domain-containing RNA-binding protein [Paenibacillus thiaminolyticus]MCY9601765.1 S1-like domain-containing RNA-binding protein [Paenibacillus thiaminolyticus]MCY9607103.1 S1-like domain-containing RNA-binding protein [Paenibacillus thiaminolyticus]MCY9614209.1 S1-like domain-containing RNA-binding protein [Paenibacillus thiaminolyticus]MCY9619234.1 S1-like domain-containing RNA-binding protein